MFTSRPADDAPRSPLRQHGSALLFGLVVVAFLGTVRCGFVWDDHGLVEANRLTGDLSNLPRFFTMDLWASTAETEAPPYHRPLVLVSLALDRALWGLWAPGHHLHSVLWQALAAVALLSLLRRLVSPWAAWPAAALWAVHPLNVEPVTFVAARNDPMAAAFTFGAVALLLPERGTRRHGLGGVLLLCGLLSKESALAGPLLLLALDLARKGRPGPLRRYGWGGGALAVWGALRLASGVGFSARPNAASLELLLRKLPDLAALFGQLLVLPWPLSTGRHLVYLDLAPARVVLGLTLLAVVTAWLFRRGGRVAGAGLFFAAVTLVPSLLAVAGTTLVGERYASLALGGFALALAAALQRIPPARAVVGLLLVPAVAVVQLRVRDWHDDAGLYLADARRTPNPYAWWKVGQWWSEQEHPERAWPWLVRALSGDPPYPGTCVTALTAAVRARSLEGARQALVLRDLRACPADPEAAAAEALIYAITGNWAALEETLAHTRTEVAPALWLPAAGVLARVRGRPERHARLRIRAAEAGLDPTWFDHTVEATLARHGTPTGGAEVSAPAPPLGEAPLSGPSEDPSEDPNDDPNDDGPPTSR